RVRRRREGVPTGGQADGAGGPPRPGERAALLLRAAVVVLRSAGGVRLLLPRVRRASASGPRRGAWFVPAGGASHAGEGVGGPLETARPGIGDWTEDDST